MTYADKLKHPKWQRKRLEIFNRDNWTCQSCGSVENTLHIHHTAYIKGNDPWAYPDIQLITLCERCHSLEYDPFYKDIVLHIQDLKRSGILHADIARLLGLVSHRSHNRTVFLDLMDHSFFVREDL